MRAPASASPSTGNSHNCSQRVRRPGPVFGAPSTALKSPARPICSGSASKPSSAPRPSVTARMAPTPSGGTTLTTILDATQQQQQQQALQDLQARQLELEQQLPAAEPATSTVERPNPSRAAVLVQPPQPASASAPPAPPPAAEVAPAQGPSSTGRARLERGGDQAASVQEAFTPGREGLARRTIFNRISRHYDELNDVLSLGQHWVWKKMAVKWSGAKAGQRVLDVCCGSGDIAFLLAQAVGPRGQVVGLDFAAGMLKDAASRQQAMEEDLPPQRRPRMQWVQGDAMSMTSFPDEGFDAATMGYGLRNVADIPRTLRELLRVLRPGATVAILDFNNSTDAVVDQLQALALEHVVVPYARRFGLEEEYAYLRPSIKRFPTGPEQERMALEAGFAKATHYPIGFGLMGVLVATKPGRRQL